jgi:hypothetical protein
MTGYLVSATFYVEADSAHDAEEKFEEWLTNVTTLDDEQSVAFDCIQAVGEVDDSELRDEPEAQLRAAA